MTSHTSRLLGTRLELAIMLFAVIGWAVTMAWLATGFWRILRG